MGEDDIAAFLGSIPTTRRTTRGTFSAATTMHGAEMSTPGATEDLLPPPPPPSLHQTPQHPLPEQPAQKVTVTNPVPMETETKDLSSEKGKLDHHMIQARTSKEASLTVQVTEVIRTGTGVSYQTKTIQHETVCGFDGGDGRLNDTFHGARRGAGGVGESLSSSFDPANMSCLMCSSEHQVIVATKPTVLCLADQCFPSNLSGEDNCVGVVRLENSSLAELTGITLEILEGKKLAPGSVILVGSGTHLFRVGASAYAWEWTQCVARLQNKLGSVNICPLIPIPPASMPGSFARDIGQLAVWLTDIYGKGTCGLLGTWSQLTWVADRFSEGGSLLSDSDTIKLSMPADLSGTESKAYIFRYNSSCPVTLSLFDLRATEELVRAILEALDKSFSIVLDPEKILRRVEIQSPGAKHNKKIIAIGASILGQTVSHLRSAGLEVIDLTLPGWVASPDRLAELRAKLDGMDKGEYTYILDPLSNSTFRFEQFDGTLCLPLKIGNSYHLPGAVRVVSEPVLKNTLRTLTPLLQSLTGPKVILPPLPRYLATPCCGNREHCSNFGERDYANGLLDGLTRVRNQVKTHCHDSGIQNFRVMDGVSTVLGYREGGRPKTEIILPDLKNVAARDGVHFNEAGLKNLAKGIVDMIRAVEAKDTRSFSISAPPAVYYWRGFTSSRGSSLRPKANASQSRSYKMSRHVHSKGPRAGPYKKT